LLSSAHIRKQKTKSMTENNKSSTNPTFSWVTGPSMHLVGKEEGSVVYHIPNGCKLLDYRYKVKESSGGASHTVQYVERNSKTEIDHEFNKEKKRELGGNVEVKLLPVIEIGSGKVGAHGIRHKIDSMKKHHAAKYSHSAIVVNGKTTKGGNLWGKQGELEVLIEVCLEREPRRPLWYNMLGGLIVVMLAWISLYKKSGPWYETVFGKCVRFVGKSAGEAFGGFKYLLLQEISDHTFDGKQVKAKHFPYQSFGVVMIALVVIVTAWPIIYCVVPLAKKNQYIKKWVDEVGRKINKIFGGVDENKAKKT
jgi:hypothetical protein